ncbi:lipopolysaccharide biosynthesis protein [Sphingomonas sp. RB3P16]|uniref:lipopolysaccharide biosynthesis protein n=1 Tax=Parasphingomonas frigoris TaxID=3096163 RepID=UPI002FC763D8
MSTPDPAAPPRVASFGKTAASGAVWLGSAQIVRIALTFASTAIIARVLAPDDYGVIAMVGPILALIMMFQDLGLGTAAIQADAISRQQSNALFWLNMLASGGLAAFLVLVSPAIGWFYHDARAGHVAAVLGLGLLISGSGLQHSALLNRELRFAWLGIVDITGLIVTYGMSIVLAIELRSYWALVIGTLAGSLAQNLLYWYASPFRPARPSLRGIGAMARFGGHITGFGLLNFCVRNLDDVLVARFAGASAAGLYDRSYRLMMMPLQNINGPISRILQPILARLRSEPARYRRIFGLAMRGTMLAVAPGVAVAALLSERLMPWLLGGQWKDAGPIFFWLGLAGLIQPIANLTGLLFITTGRGAAMMRWGFISAVVTIVSFAIGIQWGAVGVAQALFVSLLVRLPFLYHWSAADTPVPVRDMYGAQIEPLIGACVVGALFRAFGGTLPFFPMFAAAVALAYPAAFLTSFISRSGRGYTKELMRFAIGHSMGMTQHFSKLVRRNATSTDLSSPR